MWRTIWIVLGTIVGSGVLQSASAQDDKFALVIGITGYPGFENKLRYADDDADLFAAFIQTPAGGSFPAANVRVLRNEQATRTRILEAIKWVGLRAGGNDLVYVFFAGHGEMTDNDVAYLMPYDASQRLPQDRGLRADEFVTELKSTITANNLITFIDACYSGAAINGGMGARSASANVNNAIQHAWKEAYEDHEGLTMAFLSAAANQRSYEDQALGHGLFTWYLVQGMKGGADSARTGNNDHQVTAGELYRFVLESVEGRSRSRFPAEQSPTRSAEFSAGFPLAMVAAKRPVRRLRGPRSTTSLELKRAATTARAHITRARQLYRSGDYEGTTREARAALRLEPYSVAAHNLLGIGQYFLAEGADTSAARVYREAAIREYREAIRLDPNYQPAHFNLAIALSANGDLDGAIREYREAIRLNPTSYSPHNNLGNALKATGDLDGAIRAFREAIRLNPNGAAAHNSLGVALKANGDLAGAIRAYREAIRLDPEGHSPHNNLGNALRADGDLSGAIREYREAIRLNPQYSIGHFNLGLALEATGDRQGALSEYREALRLDSTNAAARRSVDRLSRPD